jgi:hypothetical protein
MHICKHLYLLPRLVLTQSSVKHRNGKKHQQCSKKITSFLTRKKISDINFNDLCCHLAKCLLTVTLRQYSGTRLGCFRNSAYPEFRIFFLIPYIPYSIRNCPKFRGITRNSVLRNS